jgi:hypothetical protein
VNPCSQLLPLVECGAHRVPVLHGALVPSFPFLAEGAGTRNGASTRAGTIRVAMGRRALAFEDKPNNSREQVQ